MKSKLIIIVAPSGTGKSTLIKKVQDEIPSLKWSVSCTTRPIREGEVHGRDYFFLSTSEFEKKINEGAFIEWAKVHSNYYGTLKSTVDDELNKGNFILFDLDVQGCDLIQNIYHERAQIIFIAPPSIEELEKRLRGRGTEKEEVIKERIHNAQNELLRKNDFDFLVINDEVQRAYNELKEIIKKIMGPS